jgi:predicted DsbA family dithiol-disulfide isomerase
MQVDIFADIICPWCYIGHKRFERALSQVPHVADAMVVYRPFQLDPNAPQSAISTLEYLTSRYGSRAASMTRHVGDIARAEGISMDFERALIVNTFAAHRVLRHALHDYGADVQHKLIVALFDAHFTQGLDVGDHEVLVRCAQHSGMDAERARAYLASDEGVAELREELREARAIGVSAVPTFVFNGETAIQGAQSPEIFVEALRKLS